MLKRVFSIVMFVLLVTGMLTLAVNIQPVKASGTVYIRADGNIDPPTANVTSLDNITYTLTDNIYDSIVVERDNIVIDGSGHMVQGTVVGSRGIDLAGRFNITIENTKIETFDYGIWLEGSHNNTISGNSIAANQWESIFMYDSSGNTISENNLTASPYTGMFVSDSSNNIISRNNITANSYYGIDFYSSSTNNVISENTITGNAVGLCFSNIATNNLVYHNDFANGINAIPGSDNFWDKGYPIGGNCWSNYIGTDLYSGPYQNEAGSDGIGDVPYILYVNPNILDNYPLMKPYAGPHDIGITFVATSKTGCQPIPTVGQGYCTNVTAKVLNYGEQSENSNITVCANATYIALQNVTFLGASFTEITFAWNTTGFAIGNYTINAYAWPVENETNTANNNFTGGTIYVGIPGDINGDGVVNILDAIMLANSFLATPGSSNWNPNSDINGDGVVNILDAIILSNHFLQQLP